MTSESRYIKKRKTAPFFTVPKEPCEKIIDTVEGTYAAFCFGVYCALRLLENDHRLRHKGHAFSCAVALVARRSGVSYTTASKAIGILESIGVVAVQRQGIEGTKGRAPSIYAFPEVDPVGWTGGTVD